MSRGLTNLCTSYMIKGEVIGVAFTLGAVALTTIGLKTYNRFHKKKMNANMPPDDELEAAFLEESNKS